MASTFYASPWRTTSQGAVQASSIRPLSSSTRYGSWSPVRGSYSGGNTSSTSSSQTGSNRSVQVGSGDKAINVSGGNDEAEMRKTALSLAQAQLKGDLSRMSAASGYRRVEANQTFGHRTIEANQGFRHRTAENNQMFGHRTAENNQMSGLRMREADQQFGFSRTLQKDNNDVRERMQQKGFDQEQEMFRMKDNADSRRTDRQATRAAATFRGRF